ncbi:MAG TPA: tetratricopeptide repeat protein, partial [Chthonomonadales bacterium]|nr:tetratricopeptide repeat protein [Chthonomonadales bacterium]
MQRSAENRPTAVTTIQIASQGSSPSNTRKAAGGSIERRHSRKIALAIAALLAALICWLLVLARQRMLLPVQGHLDAGVRLIREGRPQDAEAEWRKAAAIAPNNSAAWELLSELYLDTQQWHKGLLALRQLQRTSPNLPYLYSKMAACALRSGDEPLAQTLALQQLKQNPNDEASLAILAFLSEMQEDTDQQIGYLQRLIHQDPADTDTLHDLAQAYYTAGHYNRASEVASTLISLRPGEAYGYAVRAAARFEIDASSAGSDRCEQDLLTALRLDPLSAFARYTLGKLYKREDRFKQAAFQLRIAE